MDHKAAWNDYVALCKRGGSMSFLDLVRSADLKSPFAENCVKDAVEPIQKWLDSIDDSQF